MNFRIRELQKEIAKTKSWKRKKDLYRHLKRLLKTENSIQNNTKINKNRQNKTKKYKEKCEV